MYSPVEPHLMEPYTYNLPLERIAQRPAVPPEAARMLVVERRTGKLWDSTFAQIGDFLSARDLLVFNDTQVIPARLFGTISGSEREVEIVLLEDISTAGKPCWWRCIGRPMKKLRLAPQIEIGRGLWGKIEVDDTETVLLEAFSRSAEKSAQVLLEECGVMPIPPYIRDGHADLRDQVDYQTMFARVRGSIAAPTAGLHFSENLMGTLRAAGIRDLCVTLHVGRSSIRALDYDNTCSSPQAVPVSPGPEHALYDAELWEQILSQRSAGKRVVAVGTTVVRALESFARLDGRSLSQEISTSLFITPGFKFEATDALVTNFHQPGTTHLLLVEAWIGRELLERSYRHALDHGYRFLSYGDGMLLV